MALPLSLGTFQNPLLSDNTSTLRRQLASISKNRIINPRATRNKLCRNALNALKVPDHVREFHKSNPDAHGLPRAYSLKFTEPVDGSADAPSIDGARLVVGQFGHHTGGLHIDGSRIGQSNILYSPATKTYTFNDKIAAVGSDQDHRVTGYFNFESQQPTGVLGMNDRMFNVTLEPIPLVFDVRIASTPCAYYSTGEKRLVWDPTCKDWQNASWESTMEFAYDVKTDFDPILGTTTRIENYFTDKTMQSPNNQVSYTADSYGTTYTSIMNGQATQSGATLQTNIVTPTAGPSSRVNESVKSVFPSTCTFQFSPFGDSFTGAYEDSQGHVYAVEGHMKADPISLMSSLALPKRDLAARDMLQFPKDEKLTARLLGEHNGVSTVPLSITGLLNLSPMVPDPQDPSGYRDSVARLAMQDFHDIVVYYMDDDFRKLFISQTPIILSPTIQAIATDDVDANRTFYKSLQVPYLTTMLAGTTLEDASNCNGIRAGKQLKELPTNNPIFKRHSTALYHARFMEKFPSVQAYLDDQSSQDYSVKIDAICKVMCSNIDSQSSGLDASNPQYAADLANAKNDIVNLAMWAKQKRLYWAFMLLYWVQKSSLPNWYAQYTAGYASSSLGMYIKTLNSTFGTLENNQINKDGGNFMQAFNDSIRVFQMTAIIPQLVDLDSNSSDFDTIVKDCLYQFWNQYKDSTDSNLQEQAQAALQLYQQDQLRKQFYAPLSQIQRLGAAAATWNNITTMWATTVIDSSWFKVLQNGSKLLEVVQYLAVGVLIIMPIIPGVWGKMDSKLRTSWAVSVAGIASMIAIKIAQGVVRYYYLFNDIAGFGNSLKCILGFESVVDAIPAASLRMTNSFAKFFTRTSKQTTEIAENANMLRELPFAEDIEEFSMVQRMFGRNMGEVLGTIAGVALSVATIVLTAIDLAHETSGLMIAVDIMMIISASIQVLTLAAGWLVVAAGLAVEGSLLATALPALTLCATWGGPVAIAFAIVGIIIFIVWFSLQDHRSPVQIFVDDHVKPAGLYMDHLAIDYFSVIPSTDTSASLVGMSIRTAAITAAQFTGIPLPNDKSAYLHLNVGLELSHVDTIPNLDYLSDTIWSLSTDAWGKSVIATTSYNPSKKANEYWYMSTTDDSNGICCRQLPDKKVDETAYKNALQHVQWDVTVKADPVTVSSKVDANVKTPISALVTIGQGNKQLAIPYNSQWQALMSDLILYTPKSTLSNGTFAANFWMVEMQPMGPGTLTYGHNPWTLLSTQNDESNFAMFSPPSSSSGGLSWSIRPELKPDDIFELVTTPGSDEGCIRMKKGAVVTPMESTKYHVTATLTAPGGKAISQSTDITIEIQDAAKIVAGGTN